MASGASVGGGWHATNSLISPISLSSTAEHSRRPSPRTCDSADRRRSAHDLRQSAYFWRRSADAGTPVSVLRAPVSTLRIGSIAQPWLASNTLPTASPNTILAPGLGKYKSFACASEQVRPALFTGATLGTYSISKIGSSMFCNRQNGLAAQVFSSNRV